MYVIQNKQVEVEVDTSTELRPKICQNVKRGTFYCIKCYVFHMASIIYV